MILFKQGAVDLSLEHTKVQHTWIWWLNVKYLLGQFFVGTTFGKSKFLWVIFKEFLIALKHETVDLSLEYVKAQHR